MKNKALKEFGTGVLLGIVIVIMFSIKVMAAPAGEKIGEVNLLPAEHPKDQAHAYLEEQRIVIPDDVRMYCEKYGEQYDICPEILMAMCWVESNCIPTVQSADLSCKGLMQIKPSVHSERMIRLNAMNVFGVWENILIGTDYLAELLQEEQDIKVALAMYNGMSQKKIEDIRNGGSSKYIDKVLTISEMLEWVHCE